MYDLILGKQSLHDLGVILDFKEKTITIDEILLPMRNIARRCNSNQVYPGRSGSIHA